MGGCLEEEIHPSPPVICADPAPYEVDSDVTFTYSPGVDAGYYITYNSNGAGNWHLEWTCDTDLSAEGCEFTGTITVPANDTMATCYDCEAEDNLETTVGSPSIVTFDMITSTGVDGVDIYAAADHIDIDLMINGAYQNDLIFFSHDGATFSPPCVPARLAGPTP